MNDKHLPDASAENPWLPLRQLTPARIALGRTGTSLPTRPQLDFQYAHAQARDAVHLPFDHAAISDGLRQRGRDSLLLHSAAADRHVYLQRPDLGRRLDRPRCNACANTPPATTGRSTWPSWSPTASPRWPCSVTPCPSSNAWRNRRWPKAGRCRRWSGGTGTGGGGRRDR